MINAKNFGLAGGILWSLCLLFCSLLNFLWGYGSMWISLLSDVYIGYNITPFGVILGMVWAFFDAFIGLLIFAWIYNKLNG